MGGLRSPGRWHSAGRRIVYFAETPSGAMLEILAHLELDPNDDIPQNYQLLKVHVEKENIGFDMPIASLGKDWVNRLDITRASGDTWLREKRSALLRVPSAIMPETWNWLLNPLHTEAANVKVISATSYPYDPRLLR